MLNLNLKLKFSNIFGNPLSKYKDIVLNPLATLLAIYQNQIMVWN